MEQERRTSARLLPSHKLGTHNETPQCNATQTLNTPKPHNDGDDTELVTEGSKQGGKTADQTEGIRGKTPCRAQKGVWNEFRHNTDFAGTAPVREKVYDHQLAASGAQRRLEAVFANHCLHRHALDKNVTNH